MKLVRVLSQSRHAELTAFAHRHRVKRTNDKRTLGEFVPAPYAVPMVAWRDGGDLTILSDPGGPYVAKAIRGFHGAGVHLIDHLSELPERHGATEVVLQHNVLADVWPYAVNCLRVTVFDGEPLGASLIFGTDRSSRASNSADQVFALVEDDTVSAAKAQRGDMLIEASVHPVTGRKLLGVHIPASEAILLACAWAQESGLRAAGYDMVWTANGRWRCLEVNSCPMVRCHTMFGL